ncbi:hypothetical protein [Sinorhizobium medicae]|uniref:hypothetical protein n=1 Tax=Sinorhizobium medicae TaxID=110321 RepID=UPI000FD84A6D|nr:hypothetical protein [Sinorhizobium medicae]RVO69934.1 hypothetical protein CN084_31205 [Sinorhizobium medicae]
MIKQTAPLAFADLVDLIPARMSSGMKALMLFAVIPVIPVGDLALLNRTTVAQRQSGPTMLGPYEAQIRSWLEAEPTLSAAVVLQRLMNVDQTRFTNKSLRTVQMAESLASGVGP